MENPLKIDDLGVPLFLEIPILENEVKLPQCPILNEDGIFAYFFQCPKDTAKYDFNQFLSGYKQNIG